MNNKEAIDRLKEGAPFSAIYDETYEEAIALAIKALEFVEENFPKTFEDYLRGDV